ncbi:MAG: hypothetical protein M3063_01200 [Actinomycetota bacterium]|nr:hypothetical protein [Actinomycetota bacterium]
MSWLWLAVRDAAAAGTRASASLQTRDGLPGGFLAAWDATEERPPGAVKVDARAVDLVGEPGWVSLVMAPGVISLPFDDPAVSGAIRRVLSLEPAAVCSTLTVGDDRFVGALTACHELDGRLRGDPFAALFPARLLHIDGGFLGETPGLPGPVIQRYGAANPWPWDRFPSYEAP